MYRICGIIKETIGKRFWEIAVPAKKRQQASQDPGPARRGRAELRHRRRSSDPKFHEQRVLRSARHRAGQVRDAAPRIGREGVGGQCDRGIRRVEADVLSEQGQLRGSGDRRPGTQEAGSARPAQTAGRSTGVYPRATWQRASPFERASWPSRSGRNSISMSTRGRSSEQSR